MRDCCIFSIQDVTSQAPINRLDLLSCRNLMIYLGPVVQKKLLDTFHYAIGAHGFLMLGSSADLFAIVDKKNKIYRKKTSLFSRRTDLSGSPTPVPMLASTVGRIAPSKVVVKKGDPVAEAERQVLDQFGPAWVLVNSSLDIVQFRGATAPFIEPARGHPTWSLMKMLHPGLWADVRMLLHSAKNEGRAFRKAGVRLKIGRGTRVVDIEVSPVVIAGVDVHSLILFTERERVEIAEPSATSARKGGKRQSPSAKATTLLNNENTSLRDELVQTQKSLQAIIEDQNASNEEMQSSNEEVMSANEELQSTNEELETAKEELQSTNEELTTLNDELSSRNVELDQLSNDFINLLGNANVSIVMVGMDLRIRRFTPMAEKLLNLIAADVGRSLTDINLGFQIQQLEKKISEVIRECSTVELETQDRDGHWYSVRIRPYKTADHKIDGAVLVFVNIDEVKSRSDQAEAAR